MLRCDKAIIEQGAFRLAADWKVTAGGRVAVIGPSGAGKSTLLLGIAGFLPLRQGRITWNNEDLADLTPGARPVSMLFQEQNLFPHLDLMQNLGLGLSYRRLNATDRDRVAQALEKVGLGGLGARRPGELSGGQQSRAALARALLRARPILLLDEPFSALGPAMKTDMLTLVDQIATETNALVLMVTHDPEDARRFARDVILVANGAAQPPVPTAELFANPPQVLRSYLGL
jgi:thiamine transport system ATP-binding protein